jgi:predicted lipoprotein with Yx(FWY)xxD motif
MRKVLLAAVLPLFLLAGCGTTSMSSGGAAPAKMADGMLVNTKGLTLYTFDRDVVNSGKSACNGDCAVKWPPHLATASDRPAGDYTIVKRDDGRLQWAYRGKPLYSWPEDQDPGDKYGDNYLKVWHIVK